MSRRFLAGAAALAFAPDRPRGGDGPGRRPEGGAGQGRLRARPRCGRFHLEIPAKEYEAMQPPAGGFGFPGAPPAPPAAPKDKRDSERNLFGTEFPWAQGDFTADGKTYKKVGVRYAGEITYFASSAGPQTAPEDRVQQVRRPAVPRAHVAPPPRDADGPGEGPRGHRLLRVPGGGRARAAHRVRRGHADRARQVRQGVPRPVRRGGERGQAVPRRTASAPTRAC